VVRDNCWHSSLLAECTALADAGIMYCWHNVLPKICRDRVCFCGLQDKLWSCLRASCDALATSALSVWHLQRVVAKKRDPISHVLFLDVVCPPMTPLLTERFW
jgi:hypothetical protein